jgi:hypothetical protein
MWSAFPIDEQCPSIARIAHEVLSRCRCKAQDIGAEPQTEDRRFGTLARKIGVADGSVRRLAP